MVYHNINYSNNLKKKNINKMLKSFGDAHKMIGKLSNSNFKNKEHMIPKPQSKTNLF